MLDHSDTTSNTTDIVASVTSSKACHIFLCHTLGYRFQEHYGVGSQLGRGSVESNLLSVR